MLAAPLHDLRDLIPIRNAFERELLNRRAGNNKSVVFFMPYLGKGSVKLRKIVARRVRRDVGLRVDKVHLYLQRRIAEEAQELRLRHILDRHEIQYENPQRTDVLAVRTRRIHDEDILAL